MLTLKDIIDTLRQHKADLQEKYGIVVLAAFGSFVRGEQTPESDIDILIEQGQPSLGWNYFALAYELTTILQHKTDMITRDAIKPRYYDAIKKELVYMSKRLPLLLIEDMLESIKKIERYTAGIDFFAFSEDERTIDAVVRNFEIIGEACRQLPQEFKTMHNTVPWREIADFRNLLIHDYFGVSLQVVWNIITQNLSDLKQQLASLKT